MAGSGEPFFMKEYAERARRLFTSHDRRDILQDSPPQKRGWVIAFCVLASCLLWFTFSMRETYTQFFDFPTEVQDVPPGQALSELPPRTVRVQVEGEGIQLLRLYYNPPTVVLDASRDEIDLQVLTAELAGNVRHESVAPASILIRKEERITRKLPIRPRLRLDLESGFEVVGPIHVSPDSVTISGAASIVNRMNAWPTEPVEQPTVRDTVRTRVALSDTLSGLVTIDVPTVAVRADVLRFTSGSRVIEVRVADEPGGDTFTFEPPTTTVTYNVPISQYDQAQDTDDFYAYVPYHEILSDTTGNVYPLIEWPDSLLLREVHIFPNAFRYYRNLPGLD
jgi:hypothetical protein